jgi:hypothetical protein
VELVDPELLAAVGLVALEGSWVVGKDVVAGVFVFEAVVVGATEVVVGVGVEPVELAKSSPESASLVAVIVSH